jgi:protein-disulfide isomerase
LRVSEFRGARAALFGAALSALISGAAIADVAPPPPDATAPAATPTPDEAPQSPEAAAAAKAEALKIKDTDIGIGDPNAPVKWIEYASAGCPHCADLALKVIPALKAEYLDSGKVYYVLRDFPLDNVAASATVIARCLPRDQFYPFMDKLFANQDKWHGPNTTDVKGAILALAAEQGLDEAGVDACFKRQELLDQVINGLKEAETVLSVTSTPTSFIGDEVLVGTAPIEQFKALLDKALGAPTPEGNTPVPEATPEQSKPAETP